MAMTPQVPKPLKILVPQTLGKTKVDFVTFLPPPRIADTRAHRSIRQNGLLGIISRVMLQDPLRAASYRPTTPLPFLPIFL
jgi:hypothetical protein